MLTIPSNWDVATYVSHPWSTFAAICCLIIALVALSVMLLKSWRDTLLETIALAGICFFAVSRAYYTLAVEVVPWDMVGLNMFIALYALTKVDQHFYGLHHQRRRESDQPCAGRPQRRATDAVTDAPPGEQP